jgi:hypothetical protein
MLQAFAGVVATAAVPGALAAIEAADGAAFSGQSYCGGCYRHACCARGGRCGSIDGLVSRRAAQGGGYYPPLRPFPVEGAGASHPTMQ